ncbi:DUF6777 domain-containing protein [Streptomyces sp. NPDC017979]|uniref:DUF6777 domain-containing protein n=1 Tax=Streptomyces sp. NPDC017979 TaxID=3365024 RepID=UPI0037AF8192
MSAEPPTSDSGTPEPPTSESPTSERRPAGPPSGPLSDSKGDRGAPPPPEPPEGGGGGGGGGPFGEGEPGGEGSRPWWRSTPRLVLLVVGLLAVIALTLVLTLQGGSGGGQQSEVFLQAAGATGPDPYTDSTAKQSTPPAATAQPSTPPQGGNTVRAVSGGTPGLYGGTQDVASCDVEQQIGYLTANQDKNKAFASVEGIAPDKVPDYLRSLTPVQLRMDTRVTNHGWRNGSATSYQAVLQAGTAVLVDDVGVPRVRCACGNPLTPPVELKGTHTTSGSAWPGYEAQQVVVIEPAPQPLGELVVYDENGNSWFTRPTGSDGSKDQKTTPPAQSLPSTCPSVPAGQATPTNCVSAPPSTPGQPTTTPPSTPSTPTTPEQPVTPPSAPTTPEQPVTPPPASPPGQTPAPYGAPASVPAAG